MKIIEAHSHLNGLEFLLIHKLKLWEEIQEIISSASVACRNTIIASKENRIVSKSLYEPTEINAKFQELFLKAGWCNIQKILV